MNAAASRTGRPLPPVWLRVLLGVGVACALAATGIVVFGEQIRWLRLSAVLALWAALIAAFAVSKARRDAKTAELRQEESRRTYELELLREVSARREYEVKLAREAQQHAESVHREELAALREQLERLAGTLSGLLDGEVLVERLTLSAESTRVRQFGDAGRSLLAGLSAPATVTAPALAVAPLGPPEPVDVVVDAAPQPVVLDKPERPQPAPQPAPEPAVVQQPAVVQPAAAPEPVEQVAEPVEPAAEPVDIEPVEIEAAEAVTAQVYRHSPRPAEPADDDTVTIAVAAPAPVPPVAARPAASEGRTAPQTIPVQPGPDDESEDRTGRGGHTDGGLSVAELLAAYGANEPGGRRRRRRVDSEQ